MAVGATGVGKSTLMNSLISGVDNMQENDEKGYIESKNPPLEY